VTPNWNSLKNEILENSSYSYNDLIEPEIYDSICELEYNEGITFPLVTPEYAYLHYDRLFKGKRQLTQIQLIKVLEIINDSSNYVWGELGTPVVNRYISFYSESGICIGIFGVDFGGNTWATPNLARMKWGLIENMNELMDIIEK